jgi:hypothetical protein
VRPFHFPPFHQRPSPKRQPANRNAARLIAGHPCLSNRQTPPTAKLPAVRCRTEARPSRASWLASRRTATETVGCPGAHAPERISPHQSSAAQSLPDQDLHNCQRSAGTAFGSRTNGSARERPASSADEQHLQEPGQGTNRHTMRGITEPFRGGRPAASSRPTGANPRPETRLHQGPRGSDWTS